MPLLSKSGYYHDIGYIPHEGQRDIHFTPIRFKVVSNGRRWGKTIFGAREAEPNGWVPCPITGKPQLGWIVGPQYTDAEKEFGLIYDSLKAQGIDRDSIKFQNNVDSGSLHIVTSWGFELIGKSAKHPESLVGDGLNFVLMVEAGRHRRKTWGQYIRPTLSDRRGWAAFTGVPEGKSENSLLFALYQRGQSTRREDRQWKSWKRPSWTNPVVFPGGRRDPEILDAESDLTTDEFDRQYGAEFSEKVGIVMQEWDDDIHLGDFDYDRLWQTYMAVDYGFTNPFVVLFIQEGPFGEIRVIKERRFVHMDTPEVCEELQASEGALVRACTKLYPDPAEPDDTRTMARMLRIPPAGNTGGELKTRLALIRRALKVQNQHLPMGDPYRVPRLQIDRSCVELRREMARDYKWPEKKADVNRSNPENPMDKDNHGPEALGRFFKGRYGHTVSGHSGVVASDMG